MTEFTELIALDASANVRRTADGFLVAEPRVARIGVQLYQGAELGRPDLATVRVNRPESVVFDRTSLQSYAHRPITYGHPDQPVTADNWRDHSIGHVGGEVMRDGDFVRVPIVLMDQQAIDAVESGEAKQLSLGYQMALDWKGGDGFDAEMQSIVANHLAVVPSARGGPQLNIGDDDMTGTSASQTLHAVALDGISITVPEATLPIIQRYQKDTDEKLAAAAAKATEMKTANDALEEKIKAKDAEIETLKKQLEDSKIGDAKLDELVADRQRVIGIAQAILGKDGLSGSTAELRKQVVMKKMGDAAKDWDDNQIAASFNTIAADVKPVDDQTPSQQNRPGPGNIVSFDVNAGDTRGKAVAGYNSYLQDAWKEGASTSITKEGA